MSNQYEPWIAYNGGGMPPELVDKMVQIQWRRDDRYKAENRSPSRAADWYWDMSGKTDIVAYRVLIEPKPLREVWCAEFTFGLGWGLFDDANACEMKGRLAYGESFIRAVRFVEVQE